MKLGKEGKYDQNTFYDLKEFIKNETNLNVRKERRCRILRRKGTRQCPEIDTEPNPRFHGLGWCTSER